MRNFAFVLLLAALPAAGGEYALLASGARLRADRHEFEGGKVRLYTGGGYIELNADQVTGFEPDGPPARRPERETGRGRRALPPRPLNWRTPRPTSTGCRASWCAA